MLQPARRKYRKEQKGRNTGVATRGSSVAFGDFGLKCTDRGRLTARQIEAARRAISMPSPGPFVNATLYGPKCVRRSLAIADHLSRVEPAADLGFTMIRGSIR